MPLARTTVPRPKADPRESVRTYPVEVLRRLRQFFETLKERKRDMNLMRKQDRPGCVAGPVLFWGLDLRLYL